MSLARERTERGERLADVAERFLSKGRTVYLEGQLQTRKWTDQSGQDRYTTEIVLQRFRGELVLLGGGRGEGADLGGPDDLGDDQGYGSPAPRGGPGGGRSQGGGGRGRPSTIADELDDDIPF